MDEITRVLRDHYAATFERFGATAKGVDWTSEEELLFRYDKMLALLDESFTGRSEGVSLLDVGCGWGGQLQRARALEVELAYTGIDVVETMIDHARKEFPEAEFIHGDVFDLNAPQGYDYVVCNAILTQKLDVTIPAMEEYARRLMLKMFDLCRRGIAFNMMSTRVNFMVENLYYQSPSELLSWLLTEVTPRVRLDHGYSSLRSGKGKFYDFTVYAYRD